MKGTRRIATWTAAAAALLLLLAACASKTNAGSSGASNSPAATGAGGVTVNATSVGLLGTALVTSDGLTLYTLSADAGGKVTCTSSSCTSVWPPLLVPTGGTATAGSGVTASMLGTIVTPSGAKQVTYNKWPLYRFSQDSAAGQSNGQGIQSFGGVWHPIAPSGQPIVGGPSVTPSSSATAYGY
jgi:predicted lipoprotein with Yx(FWY)xxD motif